jgi:hypothetical protein
MRFERSRIGDKFKEVLPKKEAGIMCPQNKVREASKDFTGTRVLRPESCNKGFGRTGAKVCRDDLSKKASPPRKALPFW